MNIQDALKETGKAEDDTLELFYIAWRHDTTPSELWYFRKSDNSPYDELSHEAIFKEYYQSYYEVKEIRPEKAGELWQYNNLFEWCTVRKNGVIEMICAQGKDIETIDKMNLTIHNKNGWKLIYSPDKEVMAKINGEDENIERVVVKIASWYNGRYTFDSSYRKDLVGKACILEIPKDKP